MVNSVGSNAPHFVYPSAQLIGYLKYQPTKDCQPEDSRSKGIKTPHRIMKKRKNARNMQGAPGKKRQTLLGDPHLTPSSPPIPPSRESTPAAAFAAPFPLALFLALLLLANECALVFEFLLCLLGPHCRPWQVLGPPWMGVRACFAFGAESCQVK